MYFGDTMNKNIKVIFMGTPKFAVPILEGLIENYKIELVVCQPDRMKNRKGELIIPPTKELAIKNNIEVFQPISIKNDYKKITDLKPDLIITCAYGQIIPEEILTCTKYGCINVHGSLLPELRGGAPIHWALINGYKQTGITVMSMSKKMDAGDIISQASLDIDKNETLDSLYERMSKLGKNLLLKTLPSIIDGTCKYQKQDESKVTFGYNITKEEEKINFNNTVDNIHNLIRGLSSIPGAYCYLDNKRMKIYESIIIEKKLDISKYQNGEIIEIENDALIVKCNNGLLKITDIGIEGKKRCKVHEYLNGINKKSLLGKVLK